MQLPSLILNNNNIIQQVIIATMSFKAAADSMTKILTPAFYAKQVQKAIDFTRKSEQVRLVSSDSCHYATTNTPNNLYIYYLHS